MGQAYGETFRIELHRCIDYFFPGIREATTHASAVLDQLEAQLCRLAPPLWDETVGMAEGASLDARQMLAYRFFPDVRGAMQGGCSAFYLAQSDAGPLLGRNCDLEDDLSQQVQVCQVARPQDGPARITISYVGLPPINGMNEYGLGIAGTSAHTTDGRADPRGATMGILAFVMHQCCRSLSDADRVLQKHLFAGKSLNLLIGDAAGQSRLYEMVPGYAPHAMPSHADRAWTACTNTFLSGRWNWPDESEYQECSFARYGQLIQRFHDRQVAARIDAAEDLLRQVAMPGPVSTGFHGTWKTAYSAVMCLAHKKMLLAPGHPGEVGFEEVSL